MLDLLIAYFAFGVACIPLTAYAMYTTDDNSKHEVPLVFFLAVFAVCWATIPLWPAITYLIVNHIILKRKSKNEKNPKLKWESLKESWLKVTILSHDLDEALNCFLDTDDIQIDLEKEIRQIFSDIEVEYDRWAIIKKQISPYFNLVSSSETENIYEIYLIEGSAWPRINVYIDIEYDTETNTRRISYATIRNLCLEKQGEALPDFNRRLSIGSPIKNEEESPNWRFSTSGRFNAIVKKLRGTEKERFEFAVNNIMVSPTTVLGNTKTPLSNNLRDFWRYRLGDWRIIYTVDSQAKTVTFLDYTHRSRAYH